MPERRSSSRRPRPQTRVRKAAPRPASPKAAKPAPAPKRGKPTRKSAKPTRDQKTRPVAKKSASPAAQGSRPPKQTSTPRRRSKPQPAKAPAARPELEAKLLKSSAVFPAPLVVGCVKTPAGLDYLTAPEVPADLIEVRLDELIHAGVGVEVIEAALRKRRHPALLTARASREGGARKWKPDERTRLLLRLLDHADAVDLELADLPRLQRVLSTAAQQGVHVILSVHALQQPASNDQLRAWVQSFLEQTAFCYKMAVRLQNQGDLHQLVDILLRNPHKRWALMGLGPDAPRSRGVLAGLGSLLVYGYLDEPTAPGQPSTKQLIKNL